MDTVGLGTETMSPSASRARTDPSEYLRTAFPMIRRRERGALLGRQWGEYELTGAVQSPSESYPFTFP